MLPWIICYLSIFTSFMTLLSAPLSYNLWVVKKSMDSNSCKFVYKSIIYLFIFWEGGGGVTKASCGSRVRSLRPRRACRTRYRPPSSTPPRPVSPRGRAGSGGSCGCGPRSSGRGWTSNTRDRRSSTGAGKQTIGSMWRVQTILSLIA